MANVHDTPLTIEELNAIDATIMNALGNSLVSVLCEYKAKSGRSVNYETGAITEQTKTFSFYGIEVEPTKLLIDALGLGENDKLLLTKKSYFDDESVTPALWDTITIDSQEYAIFKIWTPIPGRHYRFAIRRSGEP